MLISVATIPAEYIPVETAATRSKCTVLIGRAGRPYYVRALHGFRLPLHKATLAPERGYGQWNPRRGLPSVHPSRAQC
jgi:hypothetical protein